MAHINPGIWTCQFMKTQHKVHFFLLMDKLRSTFATTNDHNHPHTILVDKKVLFEYDFNETHTKSIYSIE